jgi:hypothetical protein
MDRDQRRHTAAAQIFGAHGVARALRRDHEDIQIGARLDQVEMDVQAVREDRAAPSFMLTVQGSSR